MGFIEDDNGFFDDPTGLGGLSPLPSSQDVGGSGGVGNPAGLNPLLHTQGSDYGRVALTVPDGYNGLRLGVSATSMSYEVVGGPASITSLQIKGRSSSSDPWLPRCGQDWNCATSR